MLFNSISFLIFFLVVAILYYLIPGPRRWILLLIASCYFYMAFIPAYILILFYLIAIDFVMGTLIEKSEGHKRKFFFAISIIANVGTLFFFKYFNFFNANVAHIANIIHWNYSIGALQIALPLGLSFHTFQSLAYVIEVYKKRYPAERHLGIYALYVMFFPQLVAGPIERPRELLPQFHTTHEFNERAIVQGLGIMLWGFFKKVVVADTIGVLVDSAYGNLHATNGIFLTIASIAFAIQLYGDFSGYSDIARGSAKVFGINLVNNFDFPYFSTSVAEFWRRWHISLSSWFRDYFYQPLALPLARISRLGIYAALFITFLVIGLWHGAAWTYIAMGALFGMYLVVGALTKAYRTRFVEMIGLSKFPKLHAIVQAAITFALVCIGWIFFRAPSIHDAFFILANLGSGWGEFFHIHFWASILLDKTITGLATYQIAIVAFSSFLMLGGEFLEQRKEISATIEKKSRWIRWGSYYALIVLILAFGYYHQRTFIYFQF